MSAAGKEAESTAARQAETVSTVDDEVKTASTVDEEAEAAVCRGQAHGGHSSQGGGGRVHRG